MHAISLHLDKTFGFVTPEEIGSFKEAAEKAAKSLHEKTGKGNDFLGWVHLPSSLGASELGALEKTAAYFRDHTELVVVVGIGGSFLGAKSVLEALSDNFWALKPKGSHPRVLFAGQNLSEDYLAELLALLDQKDYGIVVISKSGTTTEPAVAFRLLKAHLEKKIGREEASHRIVAITDERRGALRTLATREGYTTFVIPDDVGGRYSVLTPVGLLPIAIAGFDIRALVRGAAEMEKKSAHTVPFEQNIAMQYAAVRNALYLKGKTTEILANYQPKLLYIAEWWKQLYGESEGKEQKGIFPASVTFTADLHSMGQYMQEGLRNFFETVISVKASHYRVEIPHDPQNLDTLNFLSEKRIDEVNKMAELGTLLAHVDGGVPNLRIEMGKIDEYHLGNLLYFFEIACGISGYLLGVNPFDQPGVEAYKKNMFALLDKPGHEEASRAIRERLSKE